MEATQVSTACGSGQVMAMLETRPAQAGGPDFNGLPKQLHPIAIRYKLDFR
jgi:hypothetical protein